MDYWNFVGFTVWIGSEWNLVYSCESDSGADDDTGGSDSLGLVPIGG